MPTNLLRRKFDRAAPDTKSAGLASSTASAPDDARPRHVRLTVGRHTLTLELHATRTADLIWRALPLFSIAETWGESIHFDTPLKTGRERTARLNVEPGDVCFWSEDDRVVLAWGPTPISRPGEVRLMRPCNVWARAIEDPAVLAAVTPGAKVTLERSAPPAADRPA